VEFFDQSYPFFDRQRSFIFYSKHITYFVTVYVIGTQFQNFSEPDFWLSHSSVLLTEVSKTYYEFYSKANTELYKLNIGFKNVSVSLESKTESIGSAKDQGPGRRPPTKSERSGNLSLQSAVEPARYQFHQHFKCDFFKQSVWCRFSLVTVWLCNFLAKEHKYKSFS